MCWKAWHATASPRRECGIAAGFAAQDLAPDEPARPHELNHATAVKHTPLQIEQVTVRGQRGGPRRPRKQALVPPFWPTRVNITAATTSSDGR